MIKHRACLFIIVLCYGFFNAEAQNIDSLTLKVNSTIDQERLSALETLGEFYFYTQPKKSDSIYRKALKLAIKLKDERAECKILRYIGMSFNETAVVDSIFYYQNKSLALALKIKDSAYIAASYANIGNAYLTLGNHSLAINNYNKALIIFEKQDNIKSQGMIYGVFGSVYIGIKDYQQAISNYEKSREIFKEINFINGFATSTVNIGVCKYRLGRYEEALVFLKEGAKISEENNFKRLIGIAALQIGNIYFDYFKDYKNAEIQFKRTKEIAILYDDFSGIAESNYCLGKIAAIKGEDAKAIKFYKKSVEIYKKAGINIGYSSALKGLIATLKKSKITSEIINYYDELIITNNAIYNENEQAKTLELLTKFDITQKNKEIEIQNLTLKKQALEIARQHYINIFFSVLSGLLIILLYFVWRSNKYKKLNEHHKIKSRRIELEQRLLRSQMNPHFIFNALNSIQSYVSENNTMNSEIYLSRFSRLMRQILEHSQEDFILFNDDINALESYLTLEQLRFDNSFDYTFNAHIGDQEKIKIPPMLLQPFVENAILHGLEPKKTKEHIYVSFSLKKEIQPNDLFGIINCTIEDNGIGRVAAAKKDSSPNEKHLSLAMKLIRERLANYSEVTKTNYSIKIEDLYSENKLALGTKITMEIPYTQELI